MKLVEVTRLNRSGIYLSEPSIDAEWLFCDGMVLDNELERRQIWAVPTTTSSSIAKHCTPFTLPSHGLLTIDYTSIITLTQNAIFQPECTGGAGWEQATPSDPTTVADLRDPFYASTLPQIYAIAAATVVSYMLVIMLFITPRTFIVGGPGGGSGFLGRRGMISGASGSTSVAGVGRRPWLQKVAALTVTISLTIATADTFKVAEHQYDVGYMDASALTQEVVGGLVIRVVRVISDTFLWLAQVQTLIRLFPRHKEKVIIKWTGFALIVLDTTFSILNSFVASSNKLRPRKFIDAIPALSYLFALALSLLYAAWVVYYSLSKRRFAFFHPKMRNICLVAILALVAVLIPVVFFVLDISKPNVAGWGDYVRWVGAAAASVVVWEWVERIEALERDERKDGILGREIFELDEMLEVTPSDEVNWPGIGRRNRGDGGNRGGMSTGWNSMTTRTNRINRTRPPAPHLHNGSGRVADPSKGQESMMTPAIPRAATSAYAPCPTPPIVVATPVSRDNTMSAASTEYAIHYHPVSHPTSSIPENTPEQSGSGNGVASLDVEQVKVDDNRRRAQDKAPNTNKRQVGKGNSRWQAAKNPFKRRRASPPPEIPDAPGAALSLPSSDTDTDHSQDLKAKMISFAAGQRERIRTRPSRRETNIPLPVTVIPAQPRGRTWPAAIPRTTESDDVHQNIDAQRSVPEIDYSKTKGKAIERPSRPTEYGESFVVQQRNDRYSPTDTNNQLLSQRGTLMISEERFRRSPSQSPPIVAPGQSVGQLSNIEGRQTPDGPDLSQTQTSTQGLSISSCMTTHPASASAFEPTSIHQDHCTSRPLTDPQEPDFAGTRSASPSAFPEGGYKQRRPHDSQTGVEP